LPAVHILLIPHAYILTALQELPWACKQAAAGELGIPCHQHRRVRVPSRGGSRGETAPGARQLLYYSACIQSWEACKLLRLRRVRVHRHSQGLSRCHVHRAWECAVPSRGGSGAETMRHTLQVHIYVKFLLFSFSPMSNY
jgi:hypothetical protein